MHPVGLLVVLLIACGGLDAASTDEVRATNAPPPPADTRPAAQPERAEVSPEASEPSTRALRLTEPSHEAPDNAPHAILWTPPSPRAVFVFLHGWRGCAPVLAHSGSVACREGDEEQEGWGLIARFRDAGQDALFVVPQLAWRARTGHPGRFAQEGYAARWLDALDVPADLPVVLLAHSAGFETALAIARHGGLGDRLRAIVLFDALYAGTERLLAWVRQDPRRRLVSYATRSGRPARQQRRLDRLARRAGLAVAHSLDAVAEATVVTQRTYAAHADVPRRHLPEVVAALSDLVGTRARETRHADPPAADTVPSAR